MTRARTTVDEPARAVEDKPAATEATDTSTADPPRHQNVKYVALAICRCWGQYAMLTLTMTYLRFQRLTRNVLIISLFLASSIPAASQSLISGPAVVIDGDTIEIRGTRIRLAGIDAPEGGQLCTWPNGRLWQCGDESAAALARYVGRSPVQCQPTGYDRNRRVLATCFKGSDDINQWMVANGWAVAFRRYSMAYVAAEERAHKAKLGLWVGTFDMPWDWRASKRRG